MKQRFFHFSHQDHHYLCTIRLSFPRRRESTLAYKMDTHESGYDTHSDTAEIRKDLYFPLNLLT